MIKIYTFSHKRSDFIEMQLRSFHKNIEGQFEFIVFNNASFDKDKRNYNEIKNLCRKNNLTCIDVINDPEIVSSIHDLHKEYIFNNIGEYSNPSIACAYPLCWAWKHIISKSDDMICIIDSDMFFINKRNISKDLQTYDLMYMPQSRGPNGEVNYMWNGISFMNLKLMPNKESIDWWCGFVEGQPADVGGQTHFYLKNHPELKKLELKVHYVGEDASCDFNPVNYEYFAIDEEKILIHMRGGSNWDNKSPEYHIKKTAWFKKILEQK